MRKATITILCMLTFVLLLGITTILHSSAAAATVYVATDGSGDYNCDGTNDQVQINQAMDFVASHSGYTTVHLKSGTYIIDDTIFIHSNTILEGEPGTVVKLKDECGWVDHKGLIEPSSKGAHNFVIRDFEVNGNLDNQTYIISRMGEPSKHGRGYHDLFRADDDSVSGDHSAPYDFEIYNMYFHDGANDGIRVKGDRSDAGIKIYDNTFYRTGHDDIFIMSAKNVYIDNNDFTWIYGDCGVRIENTDDVVITHNTLYTKASEPQGLSGIYLSLTSSAYTCHNYTVAYNTIKQVREMGIVVCNRVTGTPALDKAKDLYIHHNLIYDAIGNRGYGGGIQINGWHNTVIENNVIDNCNGDGIVTRNRFGMGSRTGYKIYIRNNIITNTGYYGGFSSSGHGINNYLDSRHDLILENNNVWNNEKGNYRNVDSHASDLNVDPLFVDRADHDYHLKPNSPIIDAGMGVYASADSTPALVLDTNGDRLVDEESSLSSVFSRWVSDVRRWVIASITSPLMDSDTALVTEPEIPSDTDCGNLDIVRGTATIDGDLSDWQNTAGITIYGASDRNPEEDNTATIKAMYDDKYLYFGYDVTDTNLQAEGLAEVDDIHLDDGVEVYLDTLHNNGALMQADDYHFIINLNGAVVDDVGTGSGKDYSYTSNILKSVKLQGSKNDAIDTDTGYVIEVAIPWSDIGGKPSEDIGLFLAINDLDTAGDVSFNWCNLKSSYAVPEDWGDAIIQA
ncbi:sugar-binding protein [Methanococcoides methylutens]|uniref:sugar-binding protein n=1 Tax=Methanococcoides methylutens TaxID=2226 RepID=UPI004043E580